MRSRLFVHLIEARITHRVRGCVCSWPQRIPPSIIHKWFGQSPALVFGRRENGFNATKHAHRELQLLHHQHRGAVAHRAARTADASPQKTASSAHSDRALKRRQRDHCGHLNGCAGHAVSTTSEVMGFVFFNSSELGMSIQYKHKTSSRIYSVLQCVIQKIHKRCSIFNYVKIIPLQNT